MKYGELRQQGLYIGSGTVEAACRTDVARRCKQAGMHWRLHNAAATCALTARFRSTSQPPNPSTNMNHTPIKVDPFKKLVKPTIS